MSEVAVSVVVATYNRAHLLRRLIDALERQGDGVAFETIVVDDASTDATRRTLDQLATTSPFPLVALHRVTNGGAAAARNAGWRVARGDLILFTDDDCAPQPGWVAALARAAEAADIVQGATVPDPAQVGNLGPFSHTIEVTREAGEYETCNMAYRRDVLEALGGFGEEFRHPYGEDTDLAWRAKAAGFRSAFAPDAVVHHDVRPSAFGPYLRDRRRREGMVLTLHNHPELRRRLWAGAFLHQSHAATIATVAAGVAAVLRPTPAKLAAAAGSAAWYAWNCRKTRPRPQRKREWLAVVPAAFVADLYEVAVVARAAARYRTPVI